MGWCILGMLCRLIAGKQNKEITGEEQIIVGQEQRGGGLPSIIAPYDAEWMKLAETSANMGSEIDFYSA